MGDELMIAVEHGHLEQARSLLEAGADPHGDDWGFALIDEAVDREDEQMVRLLVSYGARLDVQDEQGRTRLHRVAGANRACCFGWDWIPTSLITMVGRRCTSRRRTALNKWPRR